MSDLSGQSTPLRSTAQPGIECPFAADAVAVIVVVAVVVVAVVVVAVVVEALEEPKWRSDADGEEVEGEAGGFGCKLATVGRAAGKNFPPTSKEADIQSKQPFFFLSNCLPPLLSSFLSLSLSLSFSPLPPPPHLKKSQGKISLLDLMPILSPSIQFLRGR